MPSLEELHEFAFSETICPDRAVVLELPLLPFSIGHRLLLLKQRNPLLWSSDTAASDLPFRDHIRFLIEACYTCAQTFDYRHRLEHGRVGWWESWHNRRAVNAWHRRRRRAEAAARRKFLQSGATDTFRDTFNTDYYLRETEKFRAYLAAGTLGTDLPDHQPSTTASGAATNPQPCLPVQSCPEATGRALGAPFDAVLIEHIIAAGLVRDEAAALEYPFALAHAHFLIHQESEGAIKILNADETEFRENNAARNLEAAIAAGYPDVKSHVAAVTAVAKAAKAKRDASEAALIAKMAAAAPSGPSTLNSQPSTS